MMSKLKCWWISNYRVITLEKAKELELEFVTNIYGDRINVLNCRSLWVDQYNNPYRCNELFAEEEELENC